MNRYEKICENFIKFLDTEHTIKNQLIQFEAFNETAEILKCKTRLNGADSKTNLHSAGTHLRQQVQEHQEVLKTLQVVLEDIQSYKSCLKRYFVSIKKKYYDSNSSFASIFKDENVFNSLERTHTLPSNAKKEITLIRKQLEKVLPGVEADLRYLLARNNKALELKI